MFGEALAPPMAADLLPIARDWRPDLMVHEKQRREILKELAADPYVD